MRVAVVALDDLFDTGLSSILDTLDMANALAPQIARAGRPFEVRTVGVRRRVTTHRGFRLTTSPLRPSDVIVVPALDAKSPDAMEAALARRDVADTCAALRECSRSGSLLAAACTGTFIAAASTLLDGRAATTAWWLAPAFRARFPLVQLDETHMIVDSKSVVTAGAALAHVDLALWLIRRRSPALANLVARYLVVDARPSQAPFIVPDHLANADPIAERFERWVRRHLSEPFSLSAAARAVGASERSLGRHLTRVIGRSPLAFVQDIRVEVAVHLLRTTDDSIDDIATRVGYRDGVTLRTLLRKKLGRGVRELRRQR